MRLHHKRLRSRNHSPVEARQVPKLDTWLGRAANLSQPLLLALAAFGYVYTVRPAYQKELLSEQIAAKEIELLRLQERIDAAAPTIQKLESDRMNLAAQLDTLRAQSQQAAAARQSILETQAALERQNTKLAAVVAWRSAEAASLSSAARDAALRTYHDSFSASVSLEYLRGDFDPYKIISVPTYETVTTFLLTPYDAISSALSHGDSQFIPSAAALPRDIKDEYHLRVRVALEAQKDTLARPLDDVNAIVFQIQQRMIAAAIDPTPNDRFNEAKYETTKHLTQILNDSRNREMDRTRQFMGSLTPR